MHVRTDHMLPQLRVISCRHEAVMKRVAQPTPRKRSDNITRSHFTESPLNTMCQCLCGRRFTWHLCLRCSCVVGIFPSCAHSRDFLKNPLCMIAVNIPVYIYIRLCVCSAGVHDTISMCYIGRRDVSRVYFSANVSQPTAQPQQEKWNHHPENNL